MFLHTGFREKLNSSSLLLSLLEVCRKSFEFFCSIFLKTFDFLVALHEFSTPYEKLLENAGLLFPQFRQDLLDKYYIAIGQGPHNLDTVTKLMHFGEATM